MRVGIFGAGMVGSYLGVRLSAAGVPVTMVGRAGLVERRAALAAVTLGGAEVRPSSDLEVTIDAGALARVAVCLVTVKSPSTAEAGEQLAALLATDCVVVSFQNGLDNAETLRERMPNPIAAGVVTFNVRRDAEGRLHQATQGKLFADPLAGSAHGRMKWLQAAMRRASETLELRSDILAVLAGKLLLNLNNGVCAATGLTIAESIASSDARWCFVRCLREGIAVMRAAGIRPARVSAIPPAWMAGVLSLPDAILRLLGPVVMTIDAGARSSTLQDLDHGRSTEIDDLNGAVVRLARGTGISVPANRVVTEIVHRHERSVAGGGRPAYRSPAAVRRDIERLQRRG